MSKSLVTKLFIQSLVAVAGGLVLLLVAGALALANSTFVMNGPDVVGFRSTPFGWVMVALALLGVLVLLGAAVVQFVAWVGAVANTAALPDKTWFVILLVTGLLSFGFVAMIVYLVAGPPDPQPTPAAGWQPIAAAQPGSPPASAQPGPPPASAQPGPPPASAQPGPPPVAQPGAPPTGPPPAAG